MSLSIVTYKYSPDVQDVFSRRLVVKGPSDNNLVPVQTKLWGWGI